MAQDEPEDENRRRYNSRSDVHGRTVVRPPPLDLMVSRINDLQGFASAANHPAGPIETGKFRLKGRSANGTRR